MSFNQIPCKMAQEMILVENQRKFIILCYVLITALSRKTHIKKTYLHISWYSIFFYAHLKVITTKVNETIGLFRKCQIKQKKLPRPLLMTIYKAFVRPHLD